MSQMDDASNSAERQRRSRAIKRGDLTKLCRWCGKSHTTRGQYCSDECRSASKKEQARVASQVRRDNESEDRLVSELPNEVMFAWMGLI